MYCDASWVGFNKLTVNNYFNSNPEIVLNFGSGQITKNGGRTNAVYIVSKSTEFYVNQINILIYIVTDQTKQILSYPNFR